MQTAESLTPWASPTRDSGCSGPSRARTGQPKSDARIAKIQEACAEVDEQFGVVKAAIEAEDDDAFRTATVLHAGALMDVRTAGGGLYRVRGSVATRVRIQVAATWEEPRFG